ncbi:unnamed protein product, partial [Allacma fusca]
FTQSPEFKVGESILQVLLHQDICIWTRSTTARAEGTPQINATTNVCPASLLPVSPSPDQWVLVYRRINSLHDEKVVQQQDKRGAPELHKLVLLLHCVNPKDWRRKKV